jgi:lysosome membrane protein 2
MSFYLFHVRNPLEFQENGAKPDLLEIGPFTYKEQRIKENLINFGNIITYKEKRVFTFVRELSCCDDTLNITTLNMAVIPVLNILKNEPKLFHRLVEFGLRLSGEKLFVTQPAGRLLFGYEDNLMKLLHTFSKDLVPFPYIGLFIGV